MTVSASRWLGGARSRPSIRKLCTALAILGIVLGTATLATTSANAAFMSFGYQGENQGAGS
jgi:hypothetical protein